MILTHVFKSCVSEDPHHVFSPQGERNGGKQGLCQGSKLSKGCDMKLPSMSERGITNVECRLGEQLNVMEINIDLGFL